jgi:hypothetical protein
METGCSEFLGDQPSLPPSSGTDEMNGEAVSCIYTCSQPSERPVSLSESEPVQSSRWSLVFTRQPVYNSSRICGYQCPYAMIQHMRGPKLHASHLGSVVVSVLATGPKGLGFKPSRGNGFLMAIKI